LHHPDHTHDHVVVERRTGPLGIIAALVIVAALAFGVWYYFIADDTARDDVIPDDIDVSVEE
jgi:hypothetical protein